MRHLAGTVAIAITTLLCAGAAQAQNTVYIPDVIELSGPGAVSGTNWRDGVALAVDEINAAGGILGRKIQTEHLDTQSNPGISRAQIQKDHPDVMDAALVGKPHKTLGEEPVAVVHLRPGGTATEAELRQFVRARLAAFKVPVEVRFWPETLPRNANGKIVKTELKKLFAGEGV